MPQDKSVISLPSTSKIVVLPNVATNVQQVKYNEGLYVSDSSLKATYPKSVIRIYKNPNNPKKVYFVAKDTSLLENYVFNLVDKGATKESVPNSFRLSDTQYYWSRTEDENSYRDFSIFSQPYNLDLESDVAGKQLNFYSLPPASQQSLYMLGLNSDSDIDAYYLKYNIILKAKSYITDYQNYDSFKSNKAKRAEASDVGGADQPNVDKVALYEKFLFNELTSSTDIEQDLNNIKPLSENELQLNKSVQILNLNKIQFSDFISNSYSDFVIQKIIKDEDGNLTGGESSVENTYVLWKFASDEPEIISVNSDEGNASIGLPDGTSLTSLNDKIIYIIKDNDLVPTVKDVEVVNYNLATSMRSAGTQLFTIEKLGVSAAEPQVTINGALANENLNEQFFDVNKKLNLDNQIYYVDNSHKTGVNDNGTPRNLSDDYYYSVPIDFSSVYKSKFYVFNDSFNYSEFGFVPANLDETIYEFELDQELDYENGTYIVAEIE